MTHREIYANLIYDNITQVESLEREIKLWEETLKKRVFDMKWMPKIQVVIDSIENEIKSTLEECQYYLKRIGELRDAVTCQPEPAKDEANTSV